ncbi:hypothetical protein [Halorubrum trueperi]|uniref:Uncharacterized protein n=1 Tax=Halorubrum trueperi TaxID=2004704 RepID=A0ABD5UGH7_9EURY
MTTDKQRVLAILTERDVELPDDGVTHEKIRNRGTRFRVAEDEFLAFRLERHPTMSLLPERVERVLPERHKIVTFCMI